MSLVDRLICRREGHHLPSVRITASSGAFVTSYVCTCVRCGRRVEVSVQSDDKEGAA